MTAVLTSGAASALITGLLKVLEAKQPNAGPIVIQTTAGTMIDLPKRLLPATIEEFSKVLEGLEKPRVQLTL